MKTMLADTLMMKKMKMRNITASREGVEAGKISMETLWQINLFRTKELG